MTEDESVTERIKQLELDGRSAQQWAKEGKIEAWVHKFLTSDEGGETNPAFSESLQREKRWWNGPIKVKLTELSPAVGIESGMEYQVEPAYWQARTTQLANTFTDLDALPPLIVEYRDGELSVRDGNTRYSAMQRLGWTKCWIIIWYNTEADFIRHSKQLDKLERQDVKRDGRKQLLEMLAKAPNVEPEGYDRLD